MKPYSLPQEQWRGIGLAALPSEAVETIAEALVHSARLLVVTVYVGRNRQCLDELAQLANSIPGLQVLDAGGSDICFPMNHEASQGFRLATHDCTKVADIILMLD